MHKFSLTEDRVYKLNFASDKPEIGIRMEEISFSRIFSLVLCFWNSIENLFSGSKVIKNHNNVQIFGKKS